jgi:hypothetical protein
MINGYALQRKIKEHLSESKKRKEYEKWMTEYSRTKPVMLERYNERVNKFMNKVFA